MVKLEVPDDGWVPTMDDSAFKKLGGEEAVRALVERFYDEMEQHEPELAKIHRMDEHGRISRESRDRFGLFLIGWLGGPQTYHQTHGHPRLRMRHGGVSVNTGTRDAWLRSMKRAMDAREIKGGVRKFLDSRFAEVADFLRNTPE